MTDLFKNFKNNNEKRSSSDFKINTNLSINGSITITKGLLSNQTEYWCSIEKSIYGDKYLVLNDFDVNLINSSFNGLPIDNLSKLKKTLSEAGLTTISDSLEISYDESVKEVALKLQANDTFKIVYGEDFLIFDALSTEEQNIIRLEYAIKTYDDLSAAAYVLKDYVKIEEGEKIKPELKVLKTALKEARARKSNQKDFKKKSIDKFKELHNSVIPWNTIRYIF